MENPLVFVRAGSEEIRCSHDAARMRVLRALAMKPPRVNARKKPPSGLKPTRLSIV
jgi:hypothetical protein